MIPNLAGRTISQVTKSSGGFLVTLTNDREDGSYEEEVVEMPSRFEVCGRCEGKGKHVNPSVDGHGITAEEWEQDWDDESRDAYFAGRYDVTCHECAGDRVVPAVDFESLPVEWQLALEKYWRDEAEYRAMCEAERKAGC